MLIVWHLVVLVFFDQAGDITASSRWPGGNYALPKPKTGCPEERKNNGWVDGWVERQTSSTYQPLNKKSGNLNMIGYVGRGRIKINLCIRNSKAAWSSSTNSPKWPKGEYCVYSKYAIQNMMKGYIATEWYYNQQSETFASTSCTTSFFELKHDYHTREWYNYIHFQCYTNGNKKSPISLPITKPFYLLPYGSSDCQQVKWMVATSEWIKDYTYSYHYMDGKLPHHDKYYNGLKMYFCYYKSCNYTARTDKKGVFQSPGFPGKYPDGQLCSWRIMVPDNHTLQVHFTNFSLYKYDGDSLRLYENDSGAFKPKQSFFGYDSSFTITATSDVIFVFRSDEENSSTGFRAEYEIFKTPERTTTSKPPTTTTHPTTTKKPTTKLTTTQPPTTKQPTTKLPTTTEATTTYPPTTNVNWTTNETVQWTPKDKSYNERHVYPLRERTCFCDETWRIVVMVIPLAVFLLTVLVIIDIICRCRYKKALKSGAKESSADDGMVVNPTYERGNIVLDQPADTSLRDTSTVNTANEQPQSRDEPPDYEDVDYTQVDEVPPPRRSMKRQECHALQPVGNDTSAVFYHVLERPESQDQPQNHVSEPVGNGAREIFYHTLEPPTESGRPTYQNLSEVNHYTLNPLYKAAANSTPLVEVNRLYDNYIA